MLDLIRHDHWATLRLIEFVRGLSPEQRAWSAPGTYGSIELTLGHIVGAEQYYVFRLTGERPETELNEDTVADLDDLVARVGWCSAHLARLCAQGFDPDAPTHVGSDDPRRPPSLGAMLAQLIHHANEHRAHIGTVLGVHGMEGPGVSGWGYSLTRSDR